MNNKEIANFFWYGELTNLEITCIKSFVKQGFHAKLWSYNNLQVDGAESCDANLIIPESEITKYKQAHYHLNVTDFQATVSAFSDAFRINLIYKIGGGWWFDTDCYCIKSVNEFIELRKNKSLVTGVMNQHRTLIACGAYYADSTVSKYMFDELQRMCLEYNYNFNMWGAIGPDLLTNVVHKNKLYDGLVTYHKFYAIGGDQCNFYIDPLLKEKSKKYLENSYLTHIWNSVFTSINMDKNNVPKDSLLEELYNLNYEYVDSNKNEYNYGEELKCFQRYLEISNLYHTILKRAPDKTGLDHYYVSNHTMEEIKNILYSSEEFKRK